MKPLNNKIYLELLPESEQPKRTILVPDGDSMKFLKVLDVGSKVEQVKKDDIVLLFNNDFRRTEHNKGFCSENSVVLINNVPKLDRTHIIPLSGINEMSQFKKGKVVSSTDKNISKDDIVGYVKGNTLVLPDSSEIISDSSIYHKF